MDADTAFDTVVVWLDKLLIRTTGERLNGLQRQILHQVWRGQKYLEIAAQSGYTEGHIKDVGSHLWQVLSKVLGERITKSTVRMVLERYLESVADYPVTDCTVVDARLHDAQLTASPTVSLAPQAAASTNALLGRETAIADLNTLIHQGCNVIVIQGEGGLGKTTLAQHYLQTHGFDLVLELLMAKETQHITSAERVVEEWLKQDFNQEPGAELGLSLARLKRQLQQQRVGILIDNLEPALDPEGRLIAPHRQYVELLRVLADPRLQSVTLITSRDRLCEPDLTVSHYRLPRLDLDAWQQFFSRRSPVTVTTLPTLQQMHHAYGGNAKAMGILWGAIQSDFQGDMLAYWQDNQQDLLATRDLRNLVASQIDRLQQLDPAAYRLLCRLGCYRYQDQPTVCSDGLLCLLWDVPASQQRQVITSLRNRSLVEWDQGQYWLHPAIQAEAIARLRHSPDWEAAHRRAAECWTNQVTTIQTIQDGLQALEAHYHYLEIQDYAAAASVILKSRTNQWRQFLPLGSTLYRMGLLQPVLMAITQVIPHLQAPPQLSELYNILGDLYWITGQIQAAIACQEKTMALATTAQQTLIPSTATPQTHYYLRMLEVDSLLSIGLYQVDLWELDAAAELFQQVIDRSYQTTHHPWAEKATVCLALVHSYRGQRQVAATLAAAAYQTMLNQSDQLDPPVDAPPQPNTATTGRFAYFIQLLGQTYVNLGDWQRAESLYRWALQFAEASHYTQVQAKTLNGLAELHRCQGDLATALACHGQAIALLETIGATCDLANAYLQLGITQQQLGESQASQTALARAQALFAQMQASKQVQRVLAVIVDKSI